MKQNQKQVLAWMGLSEGGYVNHPKDPGGATNFGVTQKTLNAWRSMQGLGPLSVKRITRGDADEIFVDNYLRPIWFDRLPSGLDYAMGDYSVNSGASRAIKEIQRIVGVKVDGVMGVQTMAAIAERNAAQLVIELCEARLAFMKRLKIWSTFKNGWTARVMGNTLGAQTDDIGVIDRGVRLAQDRLDIPAPTVVAIGRADEAVIRPQSGALATAGFGLAGLGGIAAQYQEYAAPAALVGLAVIGFIIWRIKR